VIVSVIYMLCAATSLACCLLLLRAWRRTGVDMLFWSWLCFAGLTANNMLLVVDKLVLPLVDLSPARILVALVSVSLLVFGLLWEDR
jgi:hypothetical protein